MEIKNLLKPLEINPKQVKKIDTPQPELKPLNVGIKSDSMSLSSVATQKAPSATTSQKLTGFGEKYVNGPILEHYLSFRKDANYKNVIAKIDNAISNGASIKDLERVAFAEVKKENPSLRKEQVLSKGYNAILASVIDKKYSDPKFFNGEKDKIFHYFVSGALTVESYKGLNYTFIMPPAMKRAMAGASILTIGFLKEVASIPGNGYGKDDMQANQKGIESAKNYLRTM
ncbi:MAG: hypothetical protein U0354_09675 [Candidatus Sericytochromatia bacterium]